MSVQVLQAEFGSRIQIQSIGLRVEVLRKPLGLQFDPTDLAEEKYEIHLVAMDGSLVCGCMLLKSKEGGEMKMRQVAVIQHLQGKGIGRKMVEHAEALCREMRYNKITLHARDEALEFYLNQNYLVDGEPFTEVGIKHYKMYKQL
jgi:predicted GNAT family N-acyltransferase